MKRVLLYLLAVGLLLSGCRPQEEAPPAGAPAVESVSLTVWGAAEDQALM